jgi:hypothetical protein
MCGNSSDVTDPDPDRSAAFFAGFRNRINLSCWIRIRIQIADPDLGGQK